MTIRLQAVTPVAGPAFPEGVLRWEYTSSADSLADWALLLPPTSRGDWIVCIHGHGSHGDQLYSRQDLRENWLPAMRQTGCGILTPNLRDNAWMSPLAVHDLSALLALVRAEFGARRFVFFSGSMGGTSNLIYAAVRPEDVAAAVALGAAADPASYYTWCRSRNTGVLREIADAIEAAYRGTPDTVPEVYAAHSALANAHRLAMPVFLAHGTLDAVMPVHELRRLAGVLATKPDLVYVEVPDGNHDSPLFLKNHPAPLDWALRHLDDGPAAGRPGAERQHCREEK